MKNLKDTILEKLKVSTNLKETTKIPDTITYVDKKFLNDIYEELKTMSAHEELSEDDDLSDLFKDRINDLGKEIKELNAKYNDLANDVSNSKNDFKSCKT